MSPSFSVRVCVWFGRVRSGSWVFSGLGEPEPEAEVRRHGEARGARPPILPGEMLPLPRVSTFYMATVVPLPCVSTVFMAKEVPLRCVFTVSRAEVVPLPCISTIFAAEAALFRVVLPGADAERVDS